MADAASNKWALYGGILAVGLYMGLIWPWQEELAGQDERVALARAAAQDSSRLESQARTARTAYERRRRNLGAVFGNLPRPPEKGEARPIPSSAEMFRTVVAVAGQVGLSAPDLRPLPRSSNKFFEFEGCSFTVSAPDEASIYRFLQALVVHASEPRIRALNLRRVQGKDGPRVEAATAVSWMAYRPEGVSVAAGLATSAPPAPATGDEVASYALFGEAALRAAPPNISSSSSSSPSSPLSSSSPSSFSYPSSDASTEVAGVEGGGEEGTGEDVKSGPADAAGPAIEILGTVSIVGHDGIITTVGGEERLVLTGEEVAGWTLTRVESRTAWFEAGGKEALVKLVRETLMSDEPLAATTPEVAVIPTAPRLGVTAQVVDCRRLKGGDDLVKRGFRRGLEVRGVEEASAASALGLRVGDVIVALEGAPIRTPTQLRVAASRLARRERVEMQVAREGSVRVMTAQ